MFTGMPDLDANSGGAPAYTADVSIGHHDDDHQEPVIIQVMTDINPHRALPECVLTMKRQRNSAIMQYKTHAPAIGTNFWGAKDAVP